MAELQATQTTGESKASPVKSTLEMAKESLPEVDEVEKEEQTDETKKISGEALHVDGQGGKLASSPLTSGKATTTMAKKLSPPKSFIPALKMTSPAAALPKKETDRPRGGIRRSLSLLALRYSDRLGGCSGGASISGPAPTKIMAAKNSNPGAGSSGQLGRFTQHLLKTNLNRNKCESLALTRGLSLSRGDLLANNKHDNNSRSSIKQTRPSSMLCLSRLLDGCNPNDHNSPSLGAKFNSKFSTKNSVEAKFESSQITQDITGSGELPVSFIPTISSKATLMRQQQQQQQQQKALSNDQLQNDDDEAACNDTKLIKGANNKNSKMSTTATATEVGAVSADSNNNNNNNNLLKFNKNQWASSSSTSNLANSKTNCNVTNSLQTSKSSNNNDNNKLQAASILANNSISKPETKTKTTTRQAKGFWQIRLVFSLFNSFFLADCLFCFVCITEACLRVSLLFNHLNCEKIERERERESFEHT